MPQVDVSQLAMQPQMQAMPGPGFAWMLVAQFAIAACGLAVFLCGLWFLWGPRLERDDAPGEVGHAVATTWLARARAWRRTLSEATRLVLGLCVLLTGYHIAAYALPETWMPLRVPIERWWMLALGIGLAVGASLRMDRWEREDARLKVRPPNDPLA